VVSLRAILSATILIASTVVFPPAAAADPLPSAVSKQTPLDLFGDGEKYLVEVTRTGGTHCCYQLRVSKLKKPTKLVDIGPAATYETQKIAPSFKNLDDDPALEIVIVDNRYSFRMTAWFNPPYPQVVLDFKDGKYWISTELMRKPSVAPELLREKAAWAGEDDIQLGRKKIPSDVQGAMLDLIYGGNADQAYEFLEMIPGVDEEDVTSFRCDFALNLVSSPYWGSIRAMNPYLQDEHNLVQNPEECPEPDREILMARFDRL